MNKNRNLLFLLTTITLLLVSLSAISAVASDNDMSTSDDALISQEIGSSDIQSDSSIQDDADNKNVVNDNTKNKIIAEKTKILKSPEDTTIVNDENVNEIFSGENYGLADSIVEGSTLDFQGLIDQTHSLVINKPVNVISSTEDAVISLHTKAGSLMGEDPGNCFVINNGASYSNISGLYFNNTEFWVHNAYYVTVSNCSMIVSNASVGSGVGQTSIRYSDYFVMDNCKVSTENNGGSSSFVLTGTSHATIKNSEIQGIGNVGNLIYVGNPYNIQDKPADYTMLNTNNTVLNCTIRGQGSAISIPIQNLGVNGSVINNTILTLTSGIGGGTNGTVIGNKAYFASGISTGVGSVAYDNEICGNGTFTVGANATAYNNIIHNATLSGANAVFKNNTVKNRLTLSQPVNITDNEIKYIIATSSTAKSSNITNNNITGFVNATAANITLANNTINSTEDFAVYMTGAGSQIVDNYIATSSKAGINAVSVNANVLVENNTPEAGANLTITDETYSNFFDEDGIFNDTSVADYSVITLNGEFNNKNFIFNDKKLTVIGQNAVINNGSLSAIADAVVSFENLKINNIDSDNEYAIALSSDYNTVKNVTIVRNQKEGTSHEIFVEGNHNTIANNNISLNVSIISVDYSQYPFAISNTSAVTILGSSNVVRNNTIKAANSTESTYGTISVIDIASKNVAQDNLVTANKITVNGNGYVYGVNFGSNANYNTISSNTIVATSDYYVNGIQIGYSPATNNSINSNTINLTGTIAYGILCSAYEDIVSNTTVNSNTIYIKAYQSAAIEICGAMTDNIQNTTINANKIYSNGDYAIGIGVSGLNTFVNGSTIMINGTTNETDDTSYDIIKPTTAGIIVLNSNNVTLGNTTMNITNGSNTIIKNTQSSKIATLSATATTKYSNSNNVNIIVENSNDIEISGERAYTTQDYSVIVKDSSDVYVHANDLNATNVRGGDNAVYVDNSSDVTVELNTPRLAFLTDETYSQFFDEEGNFLENSDIIVLGDDLHNKDLTFCNNITIKNLDDYTIYNGTITFNERANGSYAGTSIVIGQINFDNVNKPVLVDNMSNATQQRQIRLNTSNIKVSGDDVVVFDSVKDAKTYTRLYLYYNNITVDAKNAVVVDFTRGEYTTSDYLDFEFNNVTVTAEESNTIVNVTRANIDFYNNSITQTGTDVITANINDAYANGLFYRGNNITITTTNTASALVLNDNHGNTPKIANNTIIVNAENPVTVITVNNATNAYIGQGSSTSEKSYWNKIIVNADNGEVPIILANSTGSTIIGNYIIANDVCGNPTVVGMTVSNNIPYETTISIEAPEVSPINNDITISATALNGSNSVNGKYELYINDELVKEETGNKIEYTFKATELGDVVIKAVYTNTTNLTKASEAETTITITKLNVSIVVDPIEANMGDEVTIKATVTDENNDNIQSGIITFTDEYGDIIGKARINDGVATFTQVINKAYDTTIIATYDGSDIYEQAAANNTLVVSKPETTVVVDDITATVGDKITLKATVNYGSEAVTGGKVVFKVNGKTLKDANGKIIYATVTDGVATVSDVEVLSTWAKDGITVEAVYSGTTKYSSARSEKTLMTITAQELKVEFSEVPESVVRGDEFTIKISVTNNNQTVNGGKIAVKLNGKTLKDANGKVIYATVENGIATITSTIAANHKLGEFNLEAIFTSPEFDKTTANSTINVVKE